MSTFDQHAADEALALSDDPALVQRQFVEFPAQLAHWNALSAEAQEHYLRAEELCERVEAQCRIAHRETLIGLGEKATVDAVNDRVHTDKRYIEARLALIDAEAYRARVRAVVAGLNAKHDMLVGIGANIRAQLNDPLIRAAFAGSAQRKTVNDDEL